MIRVHEVMSDEQARRKDETGLRWGDILELGIIAAETPDDKFLEAKKRFGESIPIKGHFK